ncbi:hypothetical protein RSK60_170005 [Ralstonia solanacearum K60]|nr:hypothetical protein RSK60_170005 [Ralstonia solanacearum K60]
MPSIYTVHARPKVLIDLRDGWPFGLKVRLFERYLEQILKIASDDSSTTLPAVQRNKLNDTLRAIAARPAPHS